MARLGAIVFESCPQRTPGKMDVGRTRNIFGVDGKKEGTFPMSTMTLICPIQMLKLLVGFVLEVLDKYVLKRKAVGLQAMFSWNTLCRVFEPDSPLWSQKFWRYHSYGQYSTTTTIVYQGK
jgi:hypothetical protein